MIKLDSLKIGQKIYLKAGGLGSSPKEAEFEGVVKNGNTKLYKLSYKSSIILAKEDHYGKEWVLYDRI